MHILRKGVLANSSEDLVMMLPHYQRDSTPTDYDVETFFLLLTRTSCTHKIFFTPKEKAAQKYAQKAYFKQSKLRDLHIAEDTTFTRTTKFETELTISTRLQSVEEDSFNRQNK